LIRRRSFDKVSCMTAQLPLSTDVQRAKLTARDFWVLADSGAFEKFAKSELIEGEIWVVNSVWAWHARTTALVTGELIIALRQIGSDLTVYTSGSVNLSEDSVPEPDVSVGEEHDGPGIPLEKLRLAVEVSDSTRKNDLGRKARLYAQAGIPEYWVVDRDEKRVVRMWSPTSNGYAREDESSFGKQVQSATLDWVTVNTAGL
jgi:Uma2 family endonuclease